MRPSILCSAMICCALLEGLSVSPCPASDRETPEKSREVPVRNARRISLRPGEVELTTLGQIVTRGNDEAVAKPGSFDDVKGKLSIHGDLHDMPVEVVRAILEVNGWKVDTDGKLRRTREGATERLSTLAYREERAE